MRVAVVGRHRRFIARDLPKFGLKISKKNPDVVISYGGDGTILESERVYPGVPKVFIRHSEICLQCKESHYSKVLRKLARKKFKIVKQIKVEGYVGRRKLIGLNEINIVSKKPIYAVRFKLSVNGKLLARNVIGDGVLVSTPFGSRAYFYSITGKTFKKGLGIAFNNPRKKMKNIVVNETSQVKVRILRDGAWMIADNNPKFVPLSAGDVITIKKSMQVARLLELKKI